MLPSLVPKADTDAIVLIFGYNVRERRIFHVEFVFLRNRIDNRGMPMPVIVLLVIIAVVACADYIYRMRGRLLRIPRVQAPYARGEA